MARVRCRFSKRWPATPRQAGETQNLKGVEPPVIRLRAQDHCVFFRDKVDCLEISRTSRENTTSSQRIELHSRSRSYFVNANKTFPDIPVSCA